MLMYCLFVDFVALHTILMPCRFCHPQSKHPHRNAQLPLPRHLSLAAPFLHLRPHPQPRPHAIVAIVSTKGRYLTVRGNSRSGPLGQLNGCFKNYRRAPGVFRECTRCVPGSDPDRGLTDSAGPACSRTCACRGLSSSSGCPSCWTRPAATWSPASVSPSPTRHRRPHIPLAD